MHFSGFAFQTFKLLFIYFLFFTHTFDSQKKKKILFKKGKTQNQYTNRRRTTESPPSDFLRGHPQTTLHHLRSPSRSLLPTPISAPSWPQFSPIGPCFSPGPPPSPRETSRLLSTPPRVPGVPFQWHLESHHKWGSWLGCWYWYGVHTAA